jgi:hypothetical protein
MSEHIAEVVPDVAKVAGKLSMSSVITGRRRVRLVPQSGQNYGSANSASVINILIQDGQAYADLLSATVSFNLTTGGTNAAVAAVGTFPTIANAVVNDDGAWSVFRRSLISVNSTLMDDTDFLAKKVNAEIYATAPQNWYNNVGSWCGLWKYNTNWVVPLAAAPGVEVAASKYNVGARITTQSAKVQSVVAGSSTGATYYAGQNKFSVPLSLLTSFFRNDTLFPSRNAGQLYVQLNLASALEALYTSTGTAQAPQFTISNLTLELDFVDLHPTYLSMMDDLIESASGSGVQWKFDAHMTATQSLSSSIAGSATALVIPGTNDAGGGGGQQSIIVSKASQNMRALQVVVQPVAKLSSGNWFPQSTFANPGFVDIQYRIGSMYFPAFTAVGEQRAYFDLQNAFGSPESIDKSGLVDNLNYYLTSWTTGAVTSNNNGKPMGGTNANPQAAATNITARPYHSDQAPVWADMWMYAYCFDRLKHATLNGIDLDGINTLTSAGSQMVVQINCNPVEASQMTAFVRFTRILVLKNGATQVVG